MGRYLNPGVMSFRISKNGKIYVDKTGLIVLTNDMINTPQRFICVSRPRRFGKSMAADMLAAYYGRGEDTRELFADMKISQDSSFDTHLNQYHVVKMDMQTFMTKTEDVSAMLERLTKAIVRELRLQYPELDFADIEDLSECMSDVFYKTRSQFVLLIDEWDCVMRRYHDQDEQRRYLDFLRNLMKDQPYIALAYMTGILPIKKYGEHSTLNMFYEYSMLTSDPLVPYFGFTEEEVCGLCEQYHMDFSDAKEWYDGYQFLDNKGKQNQSYSMYSPKSIVDAMLRGRYDSYWTQTETYDALKKYIQMNFDGLKDDIIEMLAGHPAKVNVRYFQNDMTTFSGINDVLTLLIHLGYLSYNQEEKTVSIPNKEVAEEFINSIESLESWSAAATALQDSRKLLEALWRMDQEAVAAGVEKAHQETSILKYNDENALSCAVTLAFYYAREYYNIIREMPSGKGFADLCFIPKPRYTDKPAVIMELKYGKTPDEALKQIRERNYAEALKDYHGNLLLCGICYDENKKHSCVIEYF